MGILSNGGFLISWTGNGIYEGIYVQQYDSRRAVIGDEIQVSKYAYTSYSSIVSLPNDNFGVTWNYFGVSATPGTFLKLYNTSGFNIADQIEVQEGGIPYTISLPDGNFVIISADLIYFKYIIIIMSPNGTRVYPNILLKGSRISFSATSKGFAIVVRPNNLSLKLYLYYSNGTLDETRDYSFNSSVEIDRLKLTVFPNNRYLITFSTAVLNYSEGSSQPIIIPIFTLLTLLNYLVPMNFLPLY